MRLTRFIAIPLIGILIVLGGCAATATTPPVTTPPPATPQAATPPAATPPANTPPATTPPANTPPANPTGPAKFVASNLKSPSKIAQPKEPGVFTVTITNTGAETGTYPVVIKVNGVAYQTKNVTLAGGKSEDVVFGITQDKEMKAVISVDNQEMEFAWEVF